MRKYDLKILIDHMSRENKCVRHLRNFTSSTDGSMTILALFLIMIVFTVAGFAVDVMRYDRERVRLQYALDRAVLAAADLDQELCPRVVVNDYISKEGFNTDIISNIVVEPETCRTNDDGSVEQVADLEGKRKVTASADLSIETHFMKWSGVDHIDTTATSVAEESIGNVEISLVLDVSGSMRGTKLTNLKKAANDFIDEMVLKSEDGRLSISIVPYSEQVSVPDYLMNAMNTIGANEVANCIDFQASDFTTTNFNYYDIVDDGGNIVRYGDYVPQTLHFRDNGSSDKRFNDTLVSSNTCRLETATDQREMTVIQNDPDILKGQIDNLVASGWTSIDVGLKWGLTLLDDSIQPLIAQIADSSEIPDSFAIRPAPNSTTDTLKVLVLMTDGENTYQHKVNSPYNNGPSDIYWNEDAQTYSIYDDETDQWAWPNVATTVRDSSYRRWTRDKFQDHAHGNGTYIRYRCTDYYNGTCYDMDRSQTREDSEGDAADSDPVNLEWPDVWAHSEKYAIRDMLRHAYGWSRSDEFAAASTTEIGPSTKDPRVADLCVEAEKEKVIIFSVAFEAPYGVKQMLKDCAIKPARYYEASGTQIERVFDSISTSIQNLRLTQ
ncbi:pilus assembly protein TadG-related protein [uncultured Ruegeria sp.]|uniref:pilus assembly protein TadG-related protein n=1 Tax=uncultured Ruegeria sp. TaxID=259304 RepID=UPI00261F3F12|nr:pilus assembly protein TadG-related protein [uncultured Ruegeria sp.]